MFAIPAATQQRQTTARAQTRSTFSVQDFVRREVFGELASRLWNGNSINRQQRIERRLSDALTISSARILVGSGTSSLLEQLFRQFAPFASDVVIARPSAPFYDKLVKQTGVKPTYWALTHDFLYHEALFPTIQPDSLVLLASPNPLAGTGISENTLANLLTAHPDTLFIVDETYATVPADALLRLSLQHSNLVLVRSVIISGTKLGYLVAEPYLIRTLRADAPHLPLNHIPEGVLDGLLASSLQQDCLLNQSALVAHRRHRFCEQLSAVLAPTFRVHNTESSFVLIQAYDQSTYRMFAQLVSQLEISVNDLHQTNQLAYTFQLPVGKAAENDWIVNRLAEAMAPFGMLLFL